MAVNLIYFPSLNLLDRLLRQAHSDAEEGEGIVAGDGDDFDVARVLRVIARENGGGDGAVPPVAHIRAE